MRKLVYILIAVIGFGLLYSCEEKEKTILEVSNVINLTQPTNNGTIQLTPETATQNVTFSWDALQYNLTNIAPVEYQLQIDTAGNNFADYLVLTTTTETSFSMTQLEFNTFLLGTLKIQPNIVNSVDIRIFASFSSTSTAEDYYTSVATVSVTPYEVIIVVDYPKLEVPGSYQGWDPATAPVIKSLNEDDLYEGFVFFGDDNTTFKYTQGASWDVNWGDDDADGSLDLGGADIEVATMGMYRLNVDLVNLTHQFTATNWGLIGSATSGGWDNDIDMIFDADNNVLTITTDLIVGEIKFRANDDWAINFGDTGLDGSLEQDGANIPISEAGNYTIILDLSLVIAPMYTYTITKN